MKENNEYNEILNPVAESDNNTLNDNSTADTVTDSAENNTVPVPVNTESDIVNDFVIGANNSEKKTVTREEKIKHIRRNKNIKNIAIIGCSVLLVAAIIITTVILNGKKAPAVPIITPTGDVSEETVSVPPIEDEASNIVISEADVLADKPEVEISTPETAISRVFVDGSNKVSENNEEEQNDTDDTDDTSGYVAPIEREGTSEPITDVTSSNPTIIHFGEPNSWVDPCADIYGGQMCFDEKDHIRRVAAFTSKTCYFCGKSDCPSIKRLYASNGDCCGADVDESLCPMYGKTTCPHCGKILVGIEEYVSHFNDVERSWFETHCGGGCDIIFY